MAKPIKETPILYRTDAANFYSKKKEDEELLLSVEERVRIKNQAKKIANKIIDPHQI